MVKLNPKKEALNADNRQKLEMDLEWSQPNTPYKNFLRVVSDVLDNAASGGDSFVSLGTTRDKGSITLMVQVDGQRQSLYALDLRQLDEFCESLL